MSVEIVVAAISGTIAMLSAVVAVWGQFRVNHLDHDLEKLKIKAEDERNSARYREPLVRAAADLQSRLFNILDRNFVEEFMVNGTDREKEYAANNTAFLFAQFFAWTEAVRLEIQFISMDDDQKTKALSSLQSRIYSLLQSNEFPNVLRLFAGEQRAIGERMLSLGAKGLKCYGYSDFLLPNGVSSDTLIVYLHQDVASLKTRHKEAVPRLAALQNALVELIDYLDPQFIRFPKNERSKWQPKVEAT
ncbi:MAG: hypothetical protein IAE66_05500 [Xanthomonadaceae bacterium]|nr:hypothetical protein [Xanthomonadaceae bacterium]